MRRSIPRRALLTLIQALVVSKVDYSNSVLAGVSDTLLRRLQSVLNSGILDQKVRTHHSVTRELHWLRVPERIKFRLCVLALVAFRCLHGTAPRYLAETLHLTTVPAVACGLLPHPLIFLGIAKNSKQFA